MELPELEVKENDQLKKKEQKAFDQFNELISALNDKELDEGMIEHIKGNMSNIRSELTFNTIKKEESKILDYVKREKGYVAQNNYMTLWIALGMSAIGVPIGVVIGLALDQLGFMGIGIGGGLAIGVAIGSAKDKKAKEQGKQLPITK